MNFGLTDRKIKKGERIGQGIFMPFLTVDNEDAITTKRNGGFGSSGK
jgi:dUTP pyrophosphatase